MIVTLTVNPSVDVTYDVGELLPGEVLRVASTHRDPAGKGINVARALSANDAATLALFPADADEGGWLSGALDGLGIPVATTHVRGPIRQNVTIVEADGRTTKLNEPGPRLDDLEVEALLGELERRVREFSPRWVVAAGSLPHGAPDDLYVAVAEIAHRHGARFALDTSGEALSRTVAARVADLVKPNREELAELVGRPLASWGAVEEAARSILGPADAAVLVSLGEDGALAVTADRAVRAYHAAVVPVSTVGAGDCALAGYLWADCDRPDSDLADRVRHAVAWGTAAVQLPATGVPTPENIRLDAVRVDEHPDPSIPLGGLAA